MRSALIRIRVSEQDKALFVAGAAKAGLSLSDFFRQRCLNGLQAPAQPTHPTTPPTEQASDPAQGNRHIRPLRIRPLDNSIACRRPGCQRQGFCICAFPWG